MTIQEVARKSGLSVDVVRAWERRYAAVRPARLPNNRRRYSSEDLRRLILLREAVAGGHAISRVAPMEEAEIRRLLAPSAAPSDAAILTELLMHVHSGDGEALQKALLEAAASREAADFCDRIASPLMREVGEYWLTDIALTAKEHIASSALASVLERLTQRRSGAPRGIAVFATLPRERHLVGALMAAYVASQHGFRTLVLGCGVAPDEIASVAKSVRASAVGISIVYQDGEHTIRDLAKRLDGIPLWVGGAKAQSHAMWTRCASLSDLGALLSQR